MHKAQSSCRCQKLYIFVLFEKIKILPKLTSGMIATHLLMKNQSQFKKLSYPINLANFFGPIFRTLIFRIHFSHFLHFFTSKVNASDIRICKDFENRTIHREDTELQSFWNFGSWTGIFQFFSKKIKMKKIGFPIKIWAFRFQKNC